MAISQCLNCKFLKKGGGKFCQNLDVKFRGTLVTGLVCRIHKSELMFKNGLESAIKCLGILNLLREGLELRCSEYIEH